LFSAAEPTEADIKEDSNSNGIDSVLPPKTKKFLELLIGKMEKNLRKQQSEEILSVRTEIHMLQIKVQELEQEIKKLTPLRAATPLSTTTATAAGTTPLVASAHSEQFPQKK